MWGRASWRLESSKSNPFDRLEDQLNVSSTRPFLTPPPSIYTIPYFSLPLHPSFLLIQIRPIPWQKHTTPEPPLPEPTAALRAGSNVGLPPLSRSVPPPIGKSPYLCCLRLPRRPPLPTWSSGRRR